MKQIITQSQALTLHNLVLQLDLASPNDLKTMHRYAKEQAADFVKTPPQRATWERIAKLIKQEIN